MQDPRGKSSHPLQSAFAGDPDMINLVEMFVRELPDRVGALHGALQQGAFPDLQRLSHQLKGASAGYGFPDIGTAAGRVEQTLRSSGNDYSGVRVEDLARQVDDLVELCRRATI